MTKKLSPEIESTWPWTMKRTLPIFFCWIKFILSYFHCFFSLIYLLETYIFKIYSFLVDFSINFHLLLLFIITNKIITVAVFFTFNSYVKIILIKLLIEKKTILKKRAITSLSIFSVLGEFYFAVFVSFSE